MSTELSAETQRLRDLAKRCMPHVNTEHLDGMLYQQWAGPQLPSVAMPRAHNIALRPNDVFSSGWPRSGNHWTYFLLDMILKQEATPSATSFVDSIPDIWPDERFAKFERQASPRLIGTHAQAGKHTQVLRQKCRVVYIVRNPKDAMASYYKMVSTMSPEHQFVGSWDDFFQLVMADEFTWGSWFRHVTDFEKFMTANPDVPVYVHHFEEMRENPVQCIKKLCAFLGVPDDKAEAIATAAGIDSIKNAVKDQAESNKKFFKEEGSGFIQKGVVGNWKNVFTVAQNERFDQVFKERMASSKIAQLVTKYI